MSWQKINKIKFYCFYYEGIDTPIIIESYNKEKARQKLRSIRHTLPDKYVTSRVVGETVKCPVFGISTKNINGIKHIWVGLEYSKNGWVDEKKFNE